MKHPAHPKNGFGVLVIIILLAVVLATTIGSYVVLHRQTKDSPTYGGHTVDSQTLENRARQTRDDNQAPIETTVDPATGWTRYSSPDGAYQIALANGLKFYKHADSTAIYTISVKPAGDSLAKVLPSTTGKDGVSGMFVNYFADSSKAFVNGDKQGELQTVSGLKIEKFYYYQATEPEGLGAVKGGKDWYYKISHDNHALVITYSLYPDEVSQIELVEQMARSVVLP